MISDSRVINQYNYLWRGIATVARSSPKSGSEEPLQPLPNLSNLCAESLFALIARKAVIPAQNASWARKEPKTLVLSSVPALAIS